MQLENIVKKLKEASLSEDGVCVGEIGNYYGGLSVRDNKGVKQWSIENFDGVDWQDIDDSLYNAIMLFEATDLGKKL